MNSFFIGCFVVLSTIFIIQLLLLLKKDNGVQGFNLSVDKWKISLILLAISIMVFSLLAASFSEEVTPYTQLVSGDANLVVTTSINNPSLSIALLRFGTVIFILNFLFSFVMIFRNLNILPKGRFKKR